MDLLARLNLDAREQKKRAPVGARAGSGSRSRSRQRPGRRDGGRDSSGRRGGRGEVDILGQLVLGEADSNSSKRQRAGDSGRAERRASSGERSGSRARRRASGGVLEGLLLDDGASKATRQASSILDRLDLG